MSNTASFLFFIPNNALCSAMIFARTVITGFAALHPRLKSAPLSELKTDYKKIYHLALYMNTSLLERVCLAKYIQNHNICTTENHGYSVTVQYTRPGDYHCQAISNGTHVSVAK